MNSEQIDPTIKSLYSCFLNYDYMNGGLLWKALQIHDAVSCTGDFTLHFLHKYANNAEVKRIINSIDKDLDIDWAKLGYTGEQP